MEKLNLESASSAASQLERHVIKCSNIGDLNVYLQARTRIYCIMYRLYYSHVPGNHGSRSGGKGWDSGAKP